MDKIFFMSPSPNAIKAFHVIRIIFLAFALIIFRVWHLAVIQREQKIQEAEKPKHRTILMRANRGPISDRFGIPLAVNRICYNAAIYYAQIAQIPIVSWKSDQDGNIIKIYPRKEHVRNLSILLANLLDIEAERTEDLIHAKASLLPHVPFVLKSHLTEEEYYRLKLLEKDWLGLYAEAGSERFYPKGMSGCHVLGTLGSISQKQYSSIVQEIRTLQEALSEYEQNGSLLPSYDSFEAMQQRLYELKEKSYTLNDQVGKSGVEAQFEEALRGFWGIKTFEVDRQGKALRELPGGKLPIPGKEIVLSISSELQEFAEELLIKSETYREGKSFGTDPIDNQRKSLKQPWIKGGAIVALDPQSGEVLAFASHPRFDPNDFQGAGNLKVKQKSLCRWLENERFIRSIWDGSDTLYRERKQAASRRIEQEFAPLTWDLYLSTILPETGALRTAINRIDDIKTAVQVQEDYEALVYFSHLEQASTGTDLFAAPPSHPDAAIPFKRLDGLFHAIGSKQDRLFAIDLCRLAVYSPRFSDELLHAVGSQKLSTYRFLNQAFARLEKKVKEDAASNFHKEDFTAWKALHQKKFLEEMRQKEKERKTYARPYLDYLDKKEKELFEEFWKEQRISLIYSMIKNGQPHPDREALYKQIAPLSSELGIEFLKTFRTFEELDRQLVSQHRFKTEKELAAAFYPRGGFGFSRSYAFQTGAPQGSLFKLVTAFEALRQGHHLTLIDELGEDPKTRGQIVSYTLNRVPYPRMYKGGRLPRSHAKQIGKVDLIGALEHSSNPYFSILAGDFFKNPEDLNDAARLLGFGEKTGIELPGEVAGSLPKDLKRNRTGLYSYAIGQHTLLTTPIQAALMLGAFANGGHILKPKIAKESAGLQPTHEPFSQKNCFARKELDSLGIYFPLFTAADNRDSLASLDASITDIRRSFPLANSIRAPLFEAMDRSVWSGNGSARPAAIKTLLADPVLMQEYLSLQHQMIGKTSTAEILYNFDLNPSSHSGVYKHIWFGAISFNPDYGRSTKTRWDKPELVVVVFLRFGDAGKEAAPIAAQIIRKWREIKKKHEKFHSQ